MNVGIGLWPRSSLSGNIGFEFPVFCLCSAHISRPLKFFTVELDPKRVKVKFDQAFCVTFNRILQSREFSNIFLFSSDMVTYFSLTIKFKSVWPIKNSKILLVYLTLIKQKSVIISSAFFSKTFPRFL